MIPTKVTKLFRLAIPLVAIAFITACSTVPPSGQSVVSSGLSKEGEGIVFGIIVTNYFNSKGEKITGDAVPDVGYTLRLGTATNLWAKEALNVWLGESIVGSTKYPETFFAKKLSAGEYSMFKLLASRGETRPDIRFTVTPNKATYIGTLQMDFQGTQDLLGERIAGVKFKVVDDPNNAIRTYKERNPNLDYEITTNLMK